MKGTIRSIKIFALLFAILSTSTALACTTDAWNGGTAGAPLADSPTAAVSRVSGTCAMQLSAAGSVKDISPANESEVYIRFYVLADLDSGTPVIFEAFSDDLATSSLLSVTFNGTHFEFDAGDGVSGPVAGIANGWNIIELAWVAATGMEYWVNVDSSEAATGAVGAAAGTMESVILGTDAIVDGTLTFDDYQSQRTTKVGPLPILVGDANIDGFIDSTDITAIVNEFLVDDLSEGIIDCNLDGFVDATDITCVVDIFLSE